MRHILEHQSRRLAANEAANVHTSYRRYKDKVEYAKEHGYSNREIIDELFREQDVIRQAQHEGIDPIFKEGVKNAKESCIKAIDTIIEELGRQ